MEPPVEWWYSYTILEVESCTEKNEQKKTIKSDRSDIDIRICTDFEGSYCFVHDGHKFRNWFVDASLHQEQFQQEGGRNQLSRQCVNACHLLPYCSQVWPIVTMRLNCMNNNDYCSDGLILFSIFCHFAHRFVSRTRHTLLQTKNDHNFTCAA